MATGKIAVMALAMVGRMAHFIMESGEVRPMLLVNVSEDRANGIVFLDVANDPPAESHDGSGIKVPYMSVSSAPYDPAMSPGSWNWPNVVQHVDADTASVLEHVHDALAKFRSEFLGHVNSKLDAHVEAVGKIADGMSSEFHEHVQKLGSEVAAEAMKVVDAVQNQARPAPGAGVEKVDEFSGVLPSSAAHTATGATTGSGGTNVATVAVPSAADLDAVAIEQKAANVTANAAYDAADAVQEPGAEVGSGG